jgi:hypothetical protein
VHHHVHDLSPRGPHPSLSPSMQIKYPPLLVLVSTFASLACASSSTSSHHHPSQRLHLAVTPPLLSHPHRRCRHCSSGSSSSSGHCCCCRGDDRARGTSSPNWEDRMPPPFLQLLPLLINGRSATTATVLLPPAPRPASTAAPRQQRTSC